MRTSSFLPTSSPVRAAIRNAAASFSRSLPSFRGKARLGAALGSWLTDETDDQRCLVKARMRGGGRMILDTRSRTERWTVWTGEYDYHLIRRFSAALGQKAVVLDVGANVGFWTVPLGLRVKELGGKLYAFEPVPRNFDRLRRQVELNGLGDAVSVKELALGEKPGQIEMVVEAESHASTGNAVLSTAASGVAGCEKTSATMETLANVAAREGITSCDLIKVDVEGAELLVLRGGLNEIASWRPVIFGEFNRYFMRNLGFTFSDVMELMKPMGYRYFVQRGKGRFVPADPPRPDDEDVLMVPNDANAGVLAALGVSI